MWGVYLDFVRRVTSEPRFLANIRHPEAGWKVSRSELRMFLGGEKATMQCFIRACQLMGGLAVHWVSKKSVLIRRDPIEAFRQLLAPGGDGEYCISLDDARLFEASTGLRIVDLAGRLGLRVRITN
ncbi:hypothetical protein [Vulcanisaeta souniana]|uniref:hypothetical protein n=1 Tax=Vulcanisaeta souniana TaxID=164452 RepID=UPI0006D18A24|nr:hypothetical protein [Vulcanisaeta souniana]